MDELVEVLFPESHRFGTDGGSLRDHVAATIGSLETHLQGAIYLGLHRLHTGHNSRRLPEACPGDHPEAAGGAARGEGDAGQGRPGCLRSGSRGQRHRRDRRLLSGPVRDRDLPGGPPAARPRGRGGAADADRVRALAHRHRHSPRGHDRNVVLHRSRHGHRHRRDLPHRRSGADLPGGDAGGAVRARSQPRRQGGAAAAPDHRGRRQHLRQRHHPRRQHRDRAGRRRRRQRLDHLFGPGRHSRRHRDRRRPRRSRRSLVELLRDVSAQILEAQRPIRVLRTLAWGEDVERAFFAGKGRELPRPVYRVPPEVAEAGARFRSLKALVPGDNAVEVFLRDTCDAFATAARMLAAVGTRDFYHSAVELYGRPGSLTADRKTTNLGLAEHFSRVVDTIAGRAAIPSPLDELVYAADEVVPLLTERFARFFPGLRDRGRGGRRHRGQGGGRRRRRSDQARGQVLAARSRPARVSRGARARRDGAERARPAGDAVHRLSVAADDGDPGGAGGADRVHDPDHEHRADAAARRQHAGDQDGGGGGRLLSALSVLPHPRPRRDGGLRLRAAGLSRRAGRRRGARSRRTSATSTASCG